MQIKRVNIVMAHTHINEQKADARRAAARQRRRAFDPDAAKTLQSLDQPAALLIGPEGGFDPSEQGLLRSLPFVNTESLGPRILRADTAALSLLTLWQAAKGDWN